MEEERKVKKLDDEIQELQQRRQMIVYNIKALRVEMVSFITDSIVVLSFVFL